MSSPAATTAPSAARRRRPEIEGLRAVAALLVAVYHVWFDRVSGGVDVFFTVTGFLITLTLLGHVQRTGRIDPLGYLGRLARRVWPLAGTVLLVSLTATVLLVPPALRPRNLAEIRAAALYHENWYLAINAIDYLDAEDPPTLVQHFWAMSIQGQFYLLWLVVMVLAVTVARRGRHDVRRVAALVIAAVTGASFVASVLLTAQSQQQAYFVTATRIWEFGLGALLALGIGRLTVGGPRAAAASWAGLLGLLACGLVLPVESTFPGWVALWPVACALLLLVSTRDDERRWAATRLLSWPPLVRLGGVAFGIYLWHWPLLVLYRLRSSDGGHPDLLTGAAIIGASVVLALVTNRVIERPVLAGWSGGRRTVVASALVALWATVLAGGAAAQALHEHQTASAARIAQDQREDLDGCLGRAALDRHDRCRDRLERTAVLPSRSALLDDTGGAYSCYTAADADRITSCRFGDGPRRVALVGSSHAAMFVPALRSRVDDLGWQVDTYTGNGCGWGPQRPEDPDVSDRCQSRLGETERRLLGDDPYDLVIFAGGRGNVGPDDTAERLATTLTDLRRHGSTPVVVEDNPRIGESGARCVVTASDDGLRDGECDAPRDQALAEPDLFAAAAREAAAPLVSTTDLYCTPAECPAVIGNVIVYRDAHHLTATYVETVMDAVLERIDAALDR